MPNGFQDAAAGVAGPDDDDLSFQAQGQGEGRKQIAPAHQKPDEGQGLPCHEPAGNKLWGGRAKYNEGYYGSGQSPEDDLADILPLTEVYIIIIQLPDTKNDQVDQTQGCELEEVLLKE
jgi:hypothetical protein